jgi:hypothetical protein
MQRLEQELAWLQQPPAIGREPFSLTLLRLTYMACSVVQPLLRVLAPRTVGACCSLPAPALAGLPAVCFGVWVWE